MEINKRKVGSFYEEAACDYLERQGLVVLERNFRVRQGEIDIVAKEGKAYVFVEVKYRKNKACGMPEEAVDIRKQQQICRVSLFYLSQHHIPEELPCRYDVVSICGNQLKWYRNAFPFIH